MSDNFNRALCKCENGHVFSVEYVDNSDPPDDLLDVECTECYTGYFDVIEYYHEDD